MFRHANMAQSLDGYLWAVSSLKEEKMRIRCLEDSHLEDIKPPLTIVQIGNGCEGYSSNLFTPAKSGLTSEDETLTRHVFFLEFNNEYQDLIKYSLIQQLNLPQLTSEELEDLPNQLTALQPMTLNHLKEWIKPLALKYPFSMHPNVVLIILIVSLPLMLASLGFIVWQIYKVRSRIRGFKPMAKLLLGDDLQNPKLNEETAQQILSLLWSPFPLWHITLPNQWLQTHNQNQWQGYLCHWWPLNHWTKKYHHHHHQEGSHHPPKESYQQNLLNTWWRHWRK